MLVWYQDREQFPPLLVLRRYLKLLASYATSFGVMDSDINSIEVRRLPFAIEAIPHSRFPYPQLLEI
ncbi:MAG: hypothetical protein ACRDAX_03230 [Propionibacteriaceae bacterium]